MPSDAFLCKVRSASAPSMGVGVVSELASECGRPRFTGPTEHRAAHVRTRLANTLRNTINTTKIR